MEVKPTLIYVYDPLCGWCYGFHPVMEKVRKRFADQMNIEVKPGGLAVGDRAEPIGEGYGYIKDSLGKVERTTKREFGRNFRLLVEEGSYFYDSVPPCRAQIVVNEQAPGHSLTFAGKLQSALFRDGKNLNQIENYAELLEDTDISYEAFKSEIESEETLQKLEKEFEWCRNHGATGFPTLLIRIGNETSLMARGYRPFDTIESHLHHLINNLEKITRA